MYDEEQTFICSECESEFGLVIHEANDDPKFCPFCASELDTSQNDE